MESTLCRVRLSAGGFNSLPSHPQRGISVILPGKNKDIRAKAFQAHEHPYSPSHDALRVLPVAICLYSVVKAMGKGSRSRARFVSGSRNTSLGSLMRSCCSIDACYDLEVALFGFMLFGLTGAGTP